MNLATMDANVGGARDSQSSIKISPPRLNFDNASSQKTKATSPQCQKDAARQGQTTSNDKKMMSKDEGGNSAGLWIKRLGVLFPGNVSLKDETVQPTVELESLPHPNTRRLSIDKSLRSPSVVRPSASTSYSYPQSILKSESVYSNSADVSLNLNEEATRNTGYMLKLLMMSDFFSADDRVNLGLPAAEKLECSNEDELKRECDEVGTMHTSQTPSNLATLLAYKPRRMNSMQSDVEESAPPAPVSYSNPEKALQTLLALSAIDSDSQSGDTIGKELQSLEAELAAKSNQGSGEGKGKNTDGNDGVFDSFTTMTTTGTNKDAQKRGIPKVKRNKVEGRDIQPLNESRNRLSRVKKKTFGNDRTSTQDSLEKYFPSTGSFRDLAKRHVPIKSVPNETWDIKQPPKPSSDEAATIRRLSGESLSITSTGTFRDIDKRHVRHLSEPIGDSEWEAEHPNDSDTPLSKSSSARLDSSSDTGEKNESSHNPNAGNTAEPKTAKNFFQLYMENKAKRRQEQQPTNKQTEKLSRTECKGELLLDWGDLGTESEEESVEEESNGVITIVKDDPYRRISDITTQDDFDDDFGYEQSLDTSFSLRERIRSLSIQEEPSWMQNHDNEEHSEDHNENDISSAKEVIVESVVVPETDLSRSISGSTSAGSETVKTSGRKSTSDEFSGAWSDGERSNSSSPG